MIPPARARLQRWLVDTHLWVSLAAAGLTRYAATALGLPHADAAAGVVFAATLLIYGVDAWVDDRRGLGLGRLRPLQLLVAGALLGAQLARLPPSAAVVVAVGGLPALLYGVPVRGRRLRDLPGVKPLFVSGALAVAATAVPVAVAADVVRPPLPALAATVAVLFVLVLANVCLFDLRDLGLDARHGVRTLPVCLGPAATRRLCVGLGVAAAATGAAALTGAGQPLPVDDVGAVGLVLAGVATVVCARRLRVDSGPLSFSLAVDGIAAGLGAWSLVGGDVGHLVSSLFGGPG